MATASSPAESDSNEFDGWLKKFENQVGGFRGFI